MHFNYALGRCLPILLISSIFALTCSNVPADTIQSDVYNVTDLGATSPGGPSPQFGVNSAGLGYVTDTSGNIVSPFIRTAVDYPAMTSMASLDPAASLSTLARAAASDGGYVVGSLGGQYPYALNLQTGQGQDPRVSDYHNWVQALPTDNGALNDVNKSGVAVGWAANTFTILNGDYDGGVHSGGPLAQIQHAAIINLQTGSVSDLNALVQILQPNGTPWLLEEALKIDDQGRIVVNAVSASVQNDMLVPNGSQFREFLLTPKDLPVEAPVPEPSTLAFLGLVSLMLGIRHILRRRSLLLA